MTAIEAANKFVERRRDPSRGLHLDVRGDEYRAFVRFIDSRRGGQLELIFAAGQVLIVGFDGKVSVYAETW